MIPTSKKPTVVITVQRIDSQGIYVGPETQKSKENSINSVLKDINDASDHIHNGNEYVKSGQYERAIEAYKKAYAYSENLPDGTMAGIMLIEVYEKMGRYDDGIALINEIDEKYYKSEYGHQKAATIRARLLAAKNQVTPKSQ